MTKLFAAQKSFSYSITSVCSEKHISFDSFNSCTLYEARNEKLRQIIKRLV